MLPSRDDFWIERVRRERQYHRSTFAAVVTLIHDDGTVDVRMVASGGAAFYRVPILGQLTVSVGSIVTVQRIGDYRGNNYQVTGHLASSAPPGGGYDPTIPAATSEEVVAARDSEVYGAHDTLDERLEAGDDAGLGDGKVKAVHLAPGTFPRVHDPRSLVPDGAFEVVQDAALAWWMGSYGPATIARVAGDGTAGGACLEFSARTEANTAAGIYVRFRTHSTNAALAPLDEGGIFAVGISAKRVGAADGNVIGLVIECYDRDLALLGTLTPITFAPPTDAWLRQAPIFIGPDQDYTWPAGTRYIRVQVRDTSSGMGAVNRVDMVVVRRGIQIADIADFEGGGGDHAALSNLDFPSAGHTGNLGITKADPEVRLTDTGDSEYTRVTRADTDALAARYNRVYKPGAAGYAIDLDGAQDYITLGTDAAFNLTGDHSIEMWVKTSSAARRGLFHRLENGGAYPGYNFELGGFAGAAGQLAYYNGNTGWKYGTSTNVINNGSWHHIVIVVDADVGGTFYKDGVADGDWADTTSGPPSAGAIAAEIGRSYAGGNFFLGALDEVRVYSKALSAGEVTAHYNAGAGQYGAPEANLVAGWHLDEGSGVTVADYSGNAHTGTLKPTGNEPGFVAGKFNIPGGETEVTVWQSQDGVDPNEKGIQRFGDPDGRTELRGVLEIQQRLTPANPASGKRRLFVDSADGKLRVLTSSGKNISLEERAGFRVIDAKNLLPDGAFEVDDDADGVPDWWTWPASSGGTRTLITTDSVSGRQCVQFDRTVASVGIDMYAQANRGLVDGRYIPINRAFTYSVAIWMRAVWAQAQNVIQVWVYQADRSGGYLTATMVINITPDVDWVQQVATIGPAAWHADAVYAYILVRDASTSVAAVTRVDCVRFWLP